MDKSGEDRRVRKTKKILKKGLATLLSQKSIHEITVKELTELADIHRGTFYFHYHDIYDLQDKIQQETYEEIRQIFETEYPTETQETPLPVLIAFNKYISENAEICLLLLNSNIEFAQNLSNIIRDNYLRDWIIKLNNQVKPDHLEYSCEFIMAGFVAITRHWLTCGMQLPPITLASLMIDLASNGMKSFCSEPPK